MVGVPRCIGPAGQENLSQHNILAERRLTRHRRLARLPEKITLGDALQSLAGRLARLPEKITLGDARRLTKLLAR